MRRMILGALCALTLACGVDYAPQGAPLNALESTPALAPARSTPALAIALASPLEGATSDLADAGSEIMDAIDAGEAPPEGGDAGDPEGAADAGEPDAGELDAGTKSEPQPAYNHCQRIDGCPDAGIDAG